MSDKEIIENGLKLRQKLERDYYKERYGENEPYVSTNIRVIRNEEYRKLMKGPETVYNYMRSYIIRGKLRNDWLNLKATYYDNGFLVCCFSYEKLAEACFMERRTIKRYIKNFEKAGMLTIERLNHKKVFVLGIWYKTEEDKIKECYYMNRCF
jgi:hypothetical protein